jgi:hypothetical protein
MLGDPASLLNALRILSHFVEEILMSIIARGVIVVTTDCHDREVTGFEFALRGRDREAERALKGACLARFGTAAPRRV